MENRINELEKRVAELEEIIKSLCLGEGGNIVISGGNFGDLHVGNNSNVDLTNIAISRVYANECESVTLNTCPVGTIYKTKSEVVDIDGVSDRVDDMDDTINSLEDKANEIEELIDELDDKAEEIDQKINAILSRLEDNN